MAFVEPDFPISVALYDETNTTLVRSIDTAIIGSRRWQEVLNDKGSAGLQVPLRVPNGDRSAMVINPELTDLTRGRNLRFALDGTERFAAPIRARKQTSIAEASEDSFPDDDQLRDVSCLGLLSDWDQTVVFPAPGAMNFPGADTRYFGWMSPEADISGLDSPAALRSLQGGDHPDPALDPFASIIDASVYRYFLIDFTPDHDLSGVGQGTAWDTFQWWLQGAPWGTGALPPISSKSKMYHGSFDLKAGVTYRYGFDIQGLPGAPAPGFVFSAWEIDTPAEGNINVFNGDNLLFRTIYETGITPYGWKASVDPFGVTPDVIAGKHLTEAQGRGRLGDWGIEVHGTLGRIPIFPVTVGAKGGDLLLKLASAYCDLGVSVAGKTLHMYPWGQRGSFHTSPAAGVAPIYAGLEWGRAFADAHDTTPNLAYLDHEERTA